MAPVLMLYETYTRQEVHDIFDPSSRFTPSAGTWGLWGIVPIPQAAGDFVLFVTFGREQAGHSFDEWITESGVINWQSQPRQSLSDRQVQQFIHHDPGRNNIHLFLRTSKTSPYTYLGRLAYHTHDLQKERPVHIQWQILDWNPPEACLQAMGLTLRPEESQPATQPPGDASFDWRGVQYAVNCQQLQSTISHQILSGLPEEALRFRDWYIEVDGQRLSAKWIFHLITGAGYNEFDAPTAREKLERIGLPSHMVVEPKNIEQPDLFSSPERVARSVKETTMARNYVSSTIAELKNFFHDLILIGEIRREKLGKYRLNDSHRIEILESGLVYANPFSWVASPRFINMFPMTEISDFTDKLSIRLSDFGWGNFPERAFRLEIAAKFPQINFEYTHKPKPEVFYQDHTIRPVFLYEYLPREDWDDWSFQNIRGLNRIYTEPKLFVHSTLPIQNVYGGLEEFQNATWHSVFYWLMLQLIILSDPQTGALYDPKIHLVLSDGWKDHSLARLYIEGEYLGELVDCLEPLLNCLSCCWINQTGDPTQDQQALLGMLRLFLKLDIAELGKDGRLQFTDRYRGKLFESQEKARLAYQSSKETRDQLREAIKDMRR